MECSNCTQQEKVSHGGLQRTEEGEQATELRGQVRSQVQLGNEGNKEPRRKQRGISWWPGLLVARVRERGIASAQVITGIWASPADLLFAWNVSTRTRTTQARLSLPGHPKKDKPKQASRNSIQEIQTAGGSSRLFSKRISLFVHFLAPSTQTNPAIIVKT